MSVDVVFAGRSWAFFLRPAYSPGKARLSRDLAERLAAGTPGPVQVIVQGDGPRLQEAAARHGAAVRWLRHGAVLTVDGAALAALSEDAAVDHLSGDAPVFATMAVTVPAIGADQAWGGVGGSVGVTGRGVGVAVIDSGVRPHPALAARVVAEVDFTRAGGPGVDLYGHGTHVAGIIAAAPGRPAWHRARTW